MNAVVAEQSVIGDIGLKLIRASRTRTPYIKITLSLKSKCNSEFADFAYHIICKSFVVEIVVMMVSRSLFCLFGSDGFAELANLIEVCLSKMFHL